MIEKNADNGPNPYASSYIPREKSKIVNKIEIRNKELFLAKGHLQK